MRVKAVRPDTMDNILALLTEPNELACRVALRYGLRIGDVLNLRRWQLEQGSFVIKEEKTGKRRKILVDELLRNRLFAICGKIYVFEHRTNQFKHRTRQAVYKDLIRAQKALRIKGVGTHSMRKSFAVRKYAACGDLRKIKTLLNHSSEAVTMLYALADVVEARKVGCFYDR